VGEQKEGWAERLRGRKRARRERKGDSPEKLAERHTPKGDVVDKALKLGGIERESRFKR
jgi:hypothetical protein